MLLKISRTSSASDGGVQRVSPGLGFLNRIRLVAMLGVDKCIRTFIQTTLTFVKSFSCEKLQFESGKERKFAETVQHIPHSILSRVSNTRKLRFHRRQTDCKHFRSALIKHFNIAFYNTVITKSILSLTVDSGRACTLSSAFVFPVFFLSNGHFHLSR